jgi:hypothetical protein
MKAMGIIAIRFVVVPLQGCNPIQSFQWLEINSNGKSVYAMVRDSCQSCGYNDLGEK